MHEEQRQRAHEHLKARGIERALLASLSSVKWLTGFSPPIQLGPNVFAGGPPLVWYEGGEFTLFVLDAYEADTATFNAQPGCAVVSYPGYTIERPITSAEHLTTALRWKLSGPHARGSKIGVEERELPAFLWKTLRDTFGEADLVPIDGWLDPLRRVKTAEELAKLKENFALTDIGHAAARQAVQAGQREIDVWTAVHTAIQRAAGRRVPLGNDCLVGYRQANISGWPLDLGLRPHDSLIVDLSTVLHGYWSDSCATYYAVEPTPQQIAMHRTVERALEFAISLVRPGAVAREIDRQVRQFIADAGYPVYPHHTGHGIGVTSHEAPRIVPYNDEVLEEGMVILLEPGIYLPGETAVRLEDAVLVTADGAELLTHHDKGLP
ncbi:MAG: Xaa-Pro peptidase family protein [Anaerolineae bacterium]|nr:Xaa-Pro peptidase family protein [Anaerolineae bacterium]MDW8098324.1 Xaa-Pro peptidase family protein [Anaerolineae bacterium]